MRKWIFSSLTIAASVLGQTLAPVAIPEKDRDGAGVEVTGVGQEERAEVVAEAGFRLPMMPSYGVEGPAPGVIRPDALPDPGSRREIELDRSRYGGLLGEAGRMDRPLQLLNPFAPAEYGDGTRHLTQDVFTGRAEGVVLFSIRVGGGDSSKSLMKRRGPFWRRQRVSEDVGSAAGIAAP